MARTKATSRKDGGKPKLWSVNPRQAIDTSNQKSNSQSRKSAKAEKRAKRARENEHPLTENNPSPETSSTPLNPDEDSIPPPPNTSSSTNTTLRNNLTISPSLSKSHSVTTMSILSSTPIQQRVTKTLSLLSKHPTTPPVVVILHAKAKSASKMISIVEIVKREIASGGEGGGGKWFQYNSVSEVMEEKERKEGKGKEKDVGKGKGEDGDQEMGGVDEEEEENAFETMKTPFERTIEGSVKVRAVPIMMIFLSRVRVEGLRREYGEQTNATGLPE